MRFVFLGVGGSASTAQRHTSGIYLPDHGILLDGGTNIFALRTLHDDRPLNVLMSHYHVDHSIGLFFLCAGLFAGRSEPPVTVYGPEWEDRFLPMADPASPLFPIKFPFPLKRAPERFHLGDVEVTTRAVPHPAPVLAYKLRFADGATLAYVTDTTAPGEYRDFIEGVDALIHECTFSQANAAWASVTGHSETLSVGRLAREAGVGTLYLSHVGPLEDAQALAAEVRAEFPRTVLPIEGLEYPREVAVDPRRALFAGSFDPLTVSHADIINTCTSMFSGLHVVVARNPAKDCGALFSPTERVELIRRCVPPSVTVSEWEGLTVECARQVQAGCLVRGLGRAEDYFGEIRLWKTNALLASEIQTVWVPPRSEHLDVSSSMIREAAMFGGWESVAHLVPEPIRGDVAARIAQARGA